MKSLVDLCLFCVANNLRNIKKVGTFLSKSDKEILIERLCDHDMLCPDQLPLISQHLLSSRIRTVSLGYNDQVTDTVLASLASSGCQLTSLTLKTCRKISDKGMSILCKTQKELEYLKIKTDSLSQLTDKWMSNLKSEALTTVVIMGLDIVANSGIQILIKNCPNIQELRLIRCGKSTDASVESITCGLGEKLEIVDLTDARLITDMSLYALGNGNCPNLKELHLSGCSLLTGDGLQMVQQGCPKLLCLDVGYCYRTVQTRTSLVSADVFPETLRDLSLYGLQLPSDLINTLVQRLKYIQVLRLSGNQAVDDGVIENVCSLVGKTLIELDLSACASISDDGLSSIHRHCRVIESLHLCFCKNVSGKRLEPLFNDSKRANEIKEINLNGCKKFSIETTRLIVRSSPNMEKLHLAGIREVDDELLMSLASNCTKLEKINLKGCDQVTDNGVCELARFCPLSEVVLSGIHGLTDRSIFALSNSCTSSLKEVYASACSKITRQAITYLKDCCLRRIYVEHKTPNADPDQLMAKNLDTGEFCRADLLFADATTFPASKNPEESGDFLHRLMAFGLR